MPFSTPSSSSAISMSSLTYPGGNVGFFLVLVSVAASDSGSLPIRGRPAFGRACAGATSVGDGGRHPSRSSFPSDGSGELCGPPDVNGSTTDPESPVVSVRWPLCDSPGEGADEGDGARGCPWSFVRVLSDVDCSQVTLTS